ncbi:MAG: NAD(P)/FAD-dependent oxidoreductase [Eubacteriales bacterium]
MKVAVMGAGLAGLSCAVLLEQYGLAPDIYEAQYKIGARFPNTEAIMNVLDFPVGDSFKYIEEKYKVRLKPLHPLKNLIIHGPRNSALIKGSLGYITARGNHPGSLEVQLGDMSGAPVITNSFSTLDDLRSEYDYVVVATGNSQEPRRQHIWETDVVSNLIGANLSGSFDPCTAEVWLNDFFAPQGYCFLLPYNSETASLALAVPGTEGVNLEALWKEFLKYFKRPFEIKDTFSLHSYEIGRNKSLIKENVLFTGNAGGLIMPFLGFGQFTSMLSGFEAAIAIANRNPEYYRKAMEPLVGSYYSSLKMRRILAGMNNNWYEILIRILRTKLGSATFSKFPAPILKTVAALADPFIARKPEIR